MGNTVNHIRGDSFPPSRQITTKYGDIVGKRVKLQDGKEVDAFLGIPFAKPPIDELRFAKPQPPDAWTGVKKTIKFGPRGIQNDAFFFIKWKYGQTSEDNLYLNVFTPAWQAPDDGFAVMVFVHGGAFVSDSAVKYGDIGICKHLVPHDVVVVSIQYRLGYLGFFSTGTADCVDNLALWDMTAALRWINENIAKFSGNPNNVTVFGQSAGGASVDLLALSPHSRDLFHKVIPMAGNAACEWAINEDVIEICRKFATRIGIEASSSAELISKLRKVEAMKFATSMKPDTNALSSMSTEIGPRIDGDFLPKHPNLLRAEAPTKPTLIGTCQYECLIFLLMDKSTTIARLEEIIAKQIPEAIYPEFCALRSEALRLYIDPVKDAHNKAQIKVALANLYSDLMFNNGTQKFVMDEIGGNNKNLFLYLFDYFNPKSWGILGHLMPFKGATHCTELAYLFNVGIIMDFTFTEDDDKMLALMTKLWTNFAKYGNPNGSSDDSDKLPFEWLPVDMENPQRYLLIKLQPEMGEQFHEGRPMFWANLKNYARKSPE